MNPAMSVILWCTYLVSLYFAVFWFLVFLDGGSEKTKKRKLDDNNPPTVTIVIPAWNEGIRDTGEVRGVIEDTIDNVMNLDYPKDKYELIIINDGSTDNTKDLILRTIKRYKNRNIVFIDKKQNEGKWKAMNDALYKAKGEYFIALDADSILKPKVLKRILEYFTEDEIACVLPNMKVLKPKKFIERVQWYEYVINMFYKKLMGALDCVHVAPGPFSVFRTEILKKVGGYKPGYLTEDLEITFRLQKYHYKIIQVLSVEVETKVPPQWKAWYRQRNRWFKGAFLNAIDYRKMLFRKKYGDFGIIQLPTVLITGLLGMIMLTTTIYYGLKPYVKYIWNMQFVDFDFMTFLKDLTPNLHYLDINFTNLITMIIMIFMATMIIRYAMKASNESATKQGMGALAIYFFFYYLVMGVAWLGIATDIIRGKKPKW